jgi:HlyD family secretion protein
MKLYCLLEVAMKKILLFTVIGACLAIGAGYLLFAKKQRPSYTTGRVERGAIVTRVSSTGTLNAVTTVQVGTQVSGTIQKLFVDYNSQVKKGQIIAQIDPSIFNSQIEQSQGNYQSAVANLSKLKAVALDAGRTLERNRQLLKEGIVSQSDFDAAETKYREASGAVMAAKGTILQTRGAYRQSQTNLRYATIRSPVDGIVVSRNVDVGQTVAASFQTPTLFTIAQDLTKMQINTSVDEADIGKVTEGQHALFTVDAYPEMQFRGVVSQVRIAPIVTQNVVTYDVVITVENRDLRLKPGMTANVSIEVMRKDNVLMIPSAALRFKPATNGEGTERKTSMERRGRNGAAGQKVFVLKDGKPVPIPVQSGATDDSYVELIRGELRPGQEVIVEQILPKKKVSPAGGAMGPRF